MNARVAFPRNATLNQPQVTYPRIDQRLYAVGETLAAMVEAGELDQSPPYVVAEMKRLADAILGDAIEATDLIAEQRPPTWPTAVAMGLACGALVFAGAEMVSVGSFALGVGSLIAGAGLGVWASLLRG